MRHRRTGTVIGVMAALVALTPVGADAKPSKPAQVSVQEKACKETLYERGAFRSVIDPLVPDRFELQPFDPPASPNAPPYAGPDRVRLFVTEYTCDSAVTTSGARQRSQRDVATIIVLGSGLYLWVKRGRAAQKAEKEARRAAGLRAPALVREGDAR